MPACSAAGVLAAGATFGLGGITGAGADLLTVLNDAFFYCSVREYIMDDTGASSLVSTDWSPAGRASG